MLKDVFRQFAHKTSEAVGSSKAFALATAAVLVWIATGHYYQYSDTWQLVINTGTTIVTFLMVFLIQNAQNRDSKVVHIKLNELLRGVKGARTELVDLEELNDEEIELLHIEFKALHEKLSHKMHQIKMKRKSTRNS